MSKAETILYPTPSGLYCPLGRFHIDPHMPVDKALITHAHSDHARAGHGAVLASQETCDIMKIRLGADAAGKFEVAEVGKVIAVNDVMVRFVPAGHVLGSCQIVVEYKGTRICVSGDYKRRHDPTCAPFERVESDVFVTEATFGLPVFVHPNAGQEVAKLLDSLRSNPGSDHFVGAYSLGKAQRIIRILRDLGHDEEVLLHGSMETLCNYYQSRGIDLGRLSKLVDAGGRRKGNGAIIIGPPSSIGTTWANRMIDPVIAYASGWMRIRQRAKRAGVELPLIVSDHCDWPELQQSIRDSGAGEIWVTHGNEDGLVRWCGLQGIAAKPLRLVGFVEEGDQ